MIDTQGNSALAHDFKEVFSHIMETVPTQRDGQHAVLQASWLNTPLGPMLAIGDEKVLYLLEFVEGRGLEREIERLQQKIKAVIVLGSTAPLVSITAELAAYFEGTLQQFKTPLHLLGSPFQRQVWEELMRIPYGQTRSYAAQAQAIGKKTAYRAVANANGANQLAIVIPCHRIINSNGNLGGYGGGIARKEWLIAHEKKNER